MKRLAATPRFYLERVRAQVVQARGRQYPDAGNIPAKWLARIDRLLDEAEASLEADDVSDLEADYAYVTIVGCYEDLQVLLKADTAQVAYPVVQALRRWFEVADPECDYIFTSGTNFEITTLIDVDEERDESKLQAAFDAGIHKTVQGITMPGGALGSAFHIPLVAHELGHVLAIRLGADLIGRLRRRLDADQVAAFSGDGGGVLDSWLSEVFADSVCGFVTGPAGFFALHEKLRGTDGFDRVYPPNRLRVETLAAWIRAKFGAAMVPFGVEPADWGLWPTAGAEWLVEDQVHDDRLKDLAGVFVGALDAVSEESILVAREYIPQLEYVASRLSRDLDDYLDDFYHAIPPFETRGSGPVRPTPLVSILNVAWFIAAFKLDRMQIKVAGGDGQMLVRLDHLTFKAIELSEARHVWDSVA